MAKKRGSWIWIAAGAAVVFGLAGAVRAALPELREMEGSVPQGARTGEKYIFRIQYSDPAGDRPQSAHLVTEGPEGIQRWPAEPVASGKVDYHRPTTLEFVAGPFSGGEHFARFEAESIVGKTTYPASGRGMPFGVENVWLRWVSLIIGLAVALLFLPLITFVLVRAVNPRSDPSRAARFGLLVGIVVSYAWFVFLFSALYSLVWMIILGILILGLLFALVPRRV